MQPILMPPIPMPPIPMRLGTHGRGLCFQPLFLELRVDKHRWSVAVIPTRAIHPEPYPRRHRLMDTPAPDTVHRVWQTIPWGSPPMRLIT